MPCNTPGIPVRLHRNGRNVDPDFSIDTKLYIRVQRQHIHTDLVDGHPITKVSLNAFTCNRQSCNRDKYSDPPDVLYNIDAKSEAEHFNGWAVVSLDLAMLNAKEFQHPGINLRLKAAMVHIPEECMYPHSEILFHDITQPQVNEISINSKSLKATIKGYYLDILTVESPPD